MIKRQKHPYIRKECILLQRNLERRLLYSLIEIITGLHQLLSFLLDLNMKRPSAVFDIYLQLRVYLSHDKKFPGLH